MSNENKYSVAFLFDEKNDWIRQYFIDFYFPFKEKYTYIFSTDETELNGLDIVFILGFTRILDSSFLASNHLNLVVHESDLPKGKGFSPVQWQILEGNNQIPISIIEAKKDVDSGDILLQDYFSFNGTELYEEIREAQAEATRSIIIKFLKIFPDYKATKQTGEETFFRKRTPEDSQLYPDKTIRDQINLLRIGNNKAWPSFFYYKGKKYIIKITKAED